MEIFKFLFVAAIMGLYGNIYSQEIKEHQLRINAEVSDSYRVPFDHPVMQAWINAEDKEITENDFKNADALYRKHIRESKGAENHHNLKELVLK